MRPQAPANGPNKAAAFLLRQAKAPHAENSTGRRQAFPQGHLHGIRGRPPPRFPPLPAFQGKVLPGDHGAGRYRLSGPAQTPRQYRHAQKAHKKQPLTKRDKAENKRISSERVPCENVIGYRKRFKIIADRYRNRRKRFGLRFNLLTAIYNRELAEKYAQL
jgi:hypothetical protein